MNTYEAEQAVTDKYGDAIMCQVAASFYDKFKIERVFDKETQVSGVDYFLCKDAPGRCIPQKVDIKYDYYANHNFAFELDQQYNGIGEQSWIEHDDDIWIVYFKIYLRKAYVFRTKDLKDFRNTNLFKLRTVFETNRKVNGKPGHYKNFRLDELPIHHVVDISLMVNPFENDHLLDTKKSWKDEELYK